MNLLIAYYLYSSTQVQSSSGAWSFRVVRITVRIKKKIITMLVHLRNADLPKQELRKHLLKPEAHARRG